MDDYAAPPPLIAPGDLEPRHRTAHFNLGVCQGHLKNWKAAAEAFRAAPPAKTARADALLGLGISLIHAGSPAQATEPLDKYLRLFPDHEQALFGKAVGPATDRPPGEAVEEYRKVLARNPRCEEALSNLVALFLEKTGPRIRPAATPRCWRNCSRIPRRHGSAGHPGLRRRRLPGRRAATAATWPKWRPTVTKTGSTWAWLTTKWAASKRPRKLPAGRRSESAFARRRT